MRDFSLTKERNYLHLTIQCNSQKDLDGLYSLNIRDEDAFIVSYDE